MDWLYSARVSADIKDLQPKELPNRVRRPGFNYGMTFDRIKSEDGSRGCAIRWECGTDGVGRIFDAKWWVVSLGVEESVGKRR
jgi:hypothetical protein